LRQFQCQIFIAATQEQRKMLEYEFNGLNYVQIEGYNVRYGSTSNHLAITILRQIPRLYGVIRREKAWLCDQMNIHGFDLVISDNRYGLYHPNTFSVFITHQLSIISGLGTVADYFLRKLHYQWIRRFNACWVPDAEGMPNLSGMLGHPAQKPPHTSYLGPISRLEPVPGNDRLDLLIILSGPEPHRTVVESILMVQLQSFTGSWFMVRGIPSEHPSYHPFIVNYMGKTALNQSISNAGMVITRSGYTSIMDLVKLQKKAILIPTPGQTEQEYLACYMHEQGVFMKAGQQSFNLQEALHQSSHFPFKKLQPDFHEYRAVLTRIMQSLP
jgi:hypothetical protein